MLVEGGEGNARAEPLRAARRALLQTGGSTMAEATIVADHLVEANLVGHDSHGVGMLPHYVRNLRDGKLHPNRHASFERRAAPLRWRTATWATVRSSHESQWQLLIRFDPARFVDLAWFRAVIEALVRYVKEAPPADPALPVLLPGEPERIARARRLEEGVWIDATTWREIEGAADGLGLSAAPFAAIARGSRTT